MNLLGIEIGGTKLQLVLGTSAGVITERRRLAVDLGRGAEGIRDQLAHEIPEMLRNQKIDAVGVGFGGPVDWGTGRICCSHQVPGWSEFDLAGWLRPLANAPVFVDNDANVAALGEASRGAGVGCDPVFYVTLGSGVGGGLVQGGMIYHGTTPGESEIGHVRLDRTGTILESRCSGWAVDARIRQIKAQAPDSVLAKLTKTEARGEAKHLAAALAQSDEAARTTLRELSEDLAFGLSHVFHLFHPQVIVLGGGLSGIGEPLRAAVAATLRRFVMEAFASTIDVRLAALGEDTVPVGALCLAKQRA